MPSCGSVVERCTTNNDCPPGQSCCLDDKCVQECVSTEKKPAPLDRCPLFNPTAMCGSVTTKCNSSDECAPGQKCCMDGGCVVRCVAPVELPEPGGCNSRAYLRTVAHYQISTRVIGVHVRSSIFTCSGGRSWARVDIQRTVTQLTRTFTDFHAASRTVAQLHARSRTVAQLHARSRTVNSNSQPRNVNGQLVSWTCVALRPFSGDDSRTHCCVGLMEAAISSSSTRQPRLLCLLFPRPFCRRRMPRSRPHAPVRFDAP